MLLGVRSRVERDGRRGVRVGDGDTDTLAGALARAVGGAQLLAGVSLHRVRDLLAVRVRQRARGVRAVVRGERPGVAEHRVRRRQGVAVRRLVRGVVQAGDGQDGAVQGGRDGGRPGRSPVGLPALGVVVQLGAEGLLGGGDVTGDGDVVLRAAGDLQVSRLQPRGHLGDLCLGGAEAGLRLLGGEVLPVRGRRRVGDGLGIRGKAAWRPGPRSRPGRRPGSCRTRPPCPPSPWPTRAWCPRGCAGSGRSRRGPRVCRAPARRMSSGNVAAMLTPARTAARLDLIKPPAMRFVACAVVRDVRDRAPNAGHTEWITLGSLWR